MRRLAGIEGRVAFVSGAGQGIGRAIAERLARDRVDLATILTSIIQEYYLESIDIVSGLHEVRNGLAEIPGGHSPRRA